MKRYISKVYRKAFCHYPFTSSPRFSRRSSSERGMRHQRPRRIALMCPPSIKRLIVEGATPNRFAALVVVYHCRLAGLVMLPKV